MGNVLPEPPEPTDLAVAARVAQLLLAEHERVDHTDVFALNRAHGALVETVRILLRAVGAEADGSNFLRSQEVSPGSQKNPSDQRCPAAHPDDPTPCTGLPTVTVLDRHNAGANGCQHHGARLLASLDGGRVYGLPHATPGTAIRVFKVAEGIRPFPWVGAPRTRPSQLSRAETRGEGQ
ncbi:hypothetical protein [Streptomyces scabiei]|uniref:hypothetical protein n=1 Tax=Streptomyces scabiei TaxID=1930 RepID=UPI00068DA855|nr:hypothetical protein [Streptomyces scabiei]MDX2829468.1 hypothetical protein [Streptomyces scabiei]MDX3674976.1 hypothetical protein [Streptomyces scabiei]